MCLFPDHKSYWASDNDDLEPPTTVNMCDLASQPISPLWQWSSRWPLAVDIDLEASKQSKESMGTKILKGLKEETVMAVVAGMAGMAGMAEVEAQADLKDSNTAWKKVQLL